MTDTFTQLKRSQIMAQVRSTETKPEVEVRKFLFSKGFRYRKNLKSLPGRPDIVLSKYKTILFIHGCFWHNHENCKHSVLPKTNRKYWTEKIENNIQRDRKNLHLLEQRNWRIIIVWECQIKSILKEGSVQNEFLSRLGNK